MGHNLSIDSAHVVKRVNPVTIRTNQKWINISRNMTQGKTPKNQINTFLVANIIRLSSQSFHTQMSVVCIVCVLCLFSFTPYLTLFSLLSYSFPPALVLIRCLFFFWLKAGYTPGWTSDPYGNPSLRNFLLCAYRNSPSLSNPHLIKHETGLTLCGESSVKTRLPLCSLSWPSEYPLTHTFSRTG